MRSAYQTSHLLHYQLLIGQWVSFLLHYQLHNNSTFYLNIIKSNHFDSNHKTHINLPIIQQIKQNQKPIYLIKMFEFQIPIFPLTLIQFTYILHPYANIIFKPNTDIGDIPFLSFSAQSESYRHPYEP